MDDYFVEKTKNKSKKHGIFLALVFFVAAAVFALFYGFFIISPLSFDGEKTITIPEGYSVIQAGELLHENKIIRSTLAFRILARLNSQSVKAGTYLFDQPLSLFESLERLEQGDYGNVYISLTIPEGSTNNDIVEILSSSQLTLDEAKLRQLIGSQEGYLFPDTYFFLPGDSAESVVQVLQDTFDEKYEKASVDSPIHLQESMVIMASLIEKEAGNNLEEKQIISGILWKRLERGMRLQVDAPFLYERGKGSAQLSHKDLQTDSPYNTYTRGGLTPTAIGNSGYDALYAALHPIESEYFFYLHAPDGSIHYAKTYNGHLKNIQMYLR